MIPRLTYITEELPTDVFYLNEEEAYRVTVNLPITNEDGAYPQSLMSFQVKSPKTVSVRALWHDIILHHAKEIEEAMTQYGFKCLKDWVDEPAPY